MKKFISFVMTAAMVASLVPATAFAGTDLAATAKVVGSWTELKDSDKIPNISGAKLPEVQLKVTTADQRRYSGGSAELPEAKVRLVLDNAYFKAAGLTGQTTKADVEDLAGTFASGIAVVDRDGVNKIGLSDYTPGTPAGSYKYTYASSTAVATVVSAYEGLNSAVDNYVIVGSGVTCDGATEYTSSQVVSGDTVRKILDAVEKPTPSAVADFDQEAAKAIKAAMTAGKSLPAGLDSAMDFATESEYEDGIDASGTPGLVFTGTPTGDGGTFISAAAIKAITGKTYPDDFEEAITGSDATQYTSDLTSALTTALGSNQVTVETKTPEAETPDTMTTGIDIKKIELKDDDEVEITFIGYFEVGDTISVDLRTMMDKATRDAKVSVYGDFVTADDLVYVAIEGRGITATARKVTTVAEEEYVTLNSNIVISSKVDDFVTGQWFELKLSKGFEFTDKTVANNSADLTFAKPDGNTLYMKWDGTGDEITIDKDDIQIEAVSAKSGAVCTMTVKALDKQWNGSELVSYSLPKLFVASATVEIMKVVDYKVALSVDEDEDMPVIYSGVNVDNYGITDDSDHLSLEVTAEETFPGAWSFRKGFNFELPEGVYVTDVKVVDTEAFLKTKDLADKTPENESDEADDGEIFKAFFDAYQDGSHVNFEFKKRVFDDVDTVLNKDVASMTFQLELVADPGFEGDVVLKLTGELVDDQEVTIAKFVKPYEVKAEQNDIIIDYRYTDIPTAITITEAEAGLWAKNEATFRFNIENGEKNFFAFEGDPTFEIDSKSDMELKKAEAKDGEIHFTVSTESDEAATINIKDMQLFMNRSIPAGPYDLEIGSSLADAYEAQVLFAPDHNTCSATGVETEFTTATPGHATTEGYGSDEHDKTDKDCFVGDVCDYSDTVKEAFVNVVTAGRDVDDASFTTKVVVPVGENYIVAGEKQIELDTPAYINEAGYTMLPIRAVATALGINNNNVLWDQPTKTVTILYGQRIITMSQGQKVVYVNGSAIPASAAVENTNSRTFLPMRDLATALGVTDITWDQATRTATLNGNQK